MKKNRIFALVVLCLCFSVSLISQIHQANVYGVPGACGYPDGQNPVHIPNRRNNPSPLDGTGTLGPTYTFTKCGLNFITSSNRLGQRFSPPGLIQPAAFAVSGIPSCATIEKAFLYADASGNGIAQTATILNPLAVSNNFPMTIIGSGPDKCWGYAGTYSYRADVTSIIAGNGTYTISGLTVNSPNDVDGATLMIIYSDPTVTYQGTIVIDDGCYVVNGGTATYNQTYAAPCGPTSNAQTFCIICDIQAPVVSMSLNSTPVIFTWNWWNYIQSASVVTPAQTNSVYTVTTSGDCYNLMMTGIYYQTTSCTTCPSLNNTLSLATTSTASSCSACNGTATVTPSGGTPPYTYSWSPSGGTAATANNLCPGIYTVTVTSNNGCVTNATTVNVGNAGGVTDAIAPTAVTCNALCNGSATATPSGGTGPYTYSWTPSGGTAATASALCAGTYTCTVKDVNGCTSVQTVTINQPGALSETFSIVPPGCTTPTGSATSNPTGGTGPYTYSWSPSGGTAATASGLAAGTYTCSLTDANGCTGSQTVTLNTANPVSATNISTNILCHGANTGSASVTASGGNGVYTYSWAPSGGTGASASNLTAGTYTCTITDGNGCSTTQTMTITQPPALSATTSNTIINCNGGTASGTVTVSGGTPGYIYSWSPSGGNAATASNLTAGTYTCTIHDQNGCQSTQTVVLTQPPVLTNTSSHANVLCNGQNTGSALVNVSGGTGPYTYSWTPGGGNTASINNRPAGIYTCTITDAHGCTMIRKDTITQPPPLTLSGGNDSICYGLSATITANPGGGTAPTVVSWNNSLSNGTSHIVNPLVTTVYVATVTDAHGCTKTDTIKVVVNPKPHAAFTSNATNGELLMSSGIHPIPFCLTNSSTGAVTYTWTMNTSASNQTSPCFTMTDTGSFCIRLLATSNKGCIDTARLCIHVGESMFLAPNIFTPNGDGHNDVFKIINLGMKSLRCTIYDRWGVKVYEWNSPTGFWDGKLSNGSMASDGTYYFVAELMDEANNSYSSNGFVQLIK